MTNDSRRHFLTGGAMVAVGAAASVVAPRAAEAQAAGATTLQRSYHPNEGLALGIVRAWTDNSYKDRLLSFPPPAPPDYANPHFTSSSAALAEVGVYINEPIVVTEAQYPDYLKFLSIHGQPIPKALFVLPDPLGTTFTLATAQAAMVMTPLGM